MSNEDVKELSKQILCSMVANPEIATMGEGEDSEQAQEMIKKAIALAMMHEAMYTPVVAAIMQKNT